jgi:hypothetical protein
MTIQHVSAAMGAVVGGVAGCVAAAVLAPLWQSAFGAEGIPLASPALVLAFAIQGALKAWDFAADDQRIYGAFDEAPAPRPVKRRAPAQSLKLRESV